MQASPGPDRRALLWWHLCCTGASDLKKRIKQARHAGAVCAWGWDVAVLPAPRDGRLHPRSLTALCSHQVKSVNLSDGEVLSIRGVDDDSLVVLANQTLLVEGQVIRSPTNTISVYFRTFQDEAVGTFQLHYQGRCPLPAPRPRGVGTCWALPPEAVHQPGQERAATSVVPWSRGSEMRRSGCAPRPIAVPIRQLFLHRL